MAVKGGDGVAEAFADSILAKTHERAAMRQQFTPRLAQQLMAEAARFQEIVQGTGILRPRFAHKAVAQHVGLENSIRTESRKLPHRIGCAEAEMKLGVADITGER